MTTPRCPTTERALWQAIKTHLPDVQWTRIETGQTGRGVPDLEGCWRGQAIWVELKIMRQGKITLTPTQAQWHLARAAVGGRSFILAAAPNPRGVMGAFLVLWPGREAQTLARAGVSLEAETFILHEADCWDRLRVGLFAEGSMG